LFRASLIAAGGIGWYTAKRNSDSSKYQKLAEIHRRESADPNHIPMWRWSPETEAAAKERDGEFKWLAEADRIRGSGTFFQEPRCFELRFWAFMLLVKWYVSLSIFVLIEQWVAAIVV
jgi:hypothetical protein